MEQNIPVGGETTKEDVQTEATTDVAYDSNCDLNSKPKDLNEAVGSGNIASEKTAGTTVSDRTKSLILQKISLNSNEAFNTYATKVSNSVLQLITKEDLKKLEKDDGNVGGHKGGPVFVVDLMANNDGNVSKYVTDTLLALSNEGGPASTTNSETSPVAAQSTVAQLPPDVPAAVPTQSSTATATSLKESQSPVLRSDKTAAQGTYKCEECEYYSYNKHYLKQHVDLVHSADRPYKCPFCDYAGKRSHALREHLIVHSSERPFECVHCNATFRKKGHLTNHVKLHTSQRLHKCPLCKELVAEYGVSGLDAHLKEVHNTDQLFGCDLCEYIAPNEPGILEHLRKDHFNQASRIFKCHLCSFKCTDTNAFQDHIKSHAKEHGRQLISETPAKTATSPPQPTVIKPVWIKCSACGFIGQDAEVIKQHMLQHLDDKQSKAVPTASTVHQDLSSPRAAPVTVLKCEICGFSTVDTNQLARHMDLHRGNSEVQKSTALKRNASAQEPHCTVSTIQPPAIQRSSINVTPAATSRMVSATGRLLPKLIGSAPVELIPPPVVLTTGMVQRGSIQNAKQLQTETTAGTLLPTVVSSQAAAQPLSTCTKTVIVTKQAPTSVLLQSNAIKMAVSCSESLQKQASPITAMPNTAGILVGTTQPSKQGPLEVPADTSGRADTLVPQSSTGSEVDETLSTQVKIQETNDQTVLEVSASGSEKQFNNQDSASVKRSSEGSLNIVSSIEVSPPSALSGTVVSTADSERSSETPLKLKQIPVPNFLPVSASPPKLPAQLVKPVTSVPKEEKRDADQLEVLRKSLANVQQLIEQQEKLQRRTGEGKVTYLDAKGIPQTTDMKNVVYYITPVEKKNTLKNPSTVGFTHDSTAGRFRCTICGYTCEYQRTIKAHIWKHSGNKNIEYPMFQNGPLSIYEDTPLVKEPEGKAKVTICKEETEEKQIVENKGTLFPASKKATQPVPKEEKEDGEKSDPSLPPFIVYEESKISTVAPALAHLLAARTMVGLGDDGKTVTTSSVSDDGSVEATSDTGSSPSSAEAHDITEAKSLKRPAPLKSGIGDTNDDSGLKKSKYPKLNDSVNVVVEAVDSVANEMRYTGMASQQNSPRLAARKSPDQELSDSGVSFEMAASSTQTGHSQTAPKGEAHSSCSEESTSFIDSRLVVDLHDTDDFEPEKQEFLIIDARDSKETRNPRRSRRVRSQNVKYSPSANEPDSKKAKSTAQADDSAVTLLSLLKKGPNYNPACPPAKTISSGYSAPASPGQDDPASHGDDGSIQSGAAGYKPTSGISSSLLAVIEQLRERSKTDVEDEKVSQPASKKPSRRRSRRSSVEEQPSAVLDIDNVEQLDGDMKYRCRLCHYKNESLTVLRQHMRLHKTKQPFECSLCEFMAESSETLQDHMIQHCKVRTYQCKLCSAAFNYKSQLRAHMRAHNEKIVEIRVYDNEAGNTSKNNKNADKSENAPFQCETCKREFITSFNLRIHRREGCRLEDVDLIGNYSCTQCDFISLGIREMKGHLKTHASADVLYIRKCYQCDFTTPSAATLRQHSIEEHAWLHKPLKCEKCGFTAVSTRSLKSHMKRHVNDQRFVQQPLEQYKCNLCGYVCHHLPSLKSHMWRHATDEQYSYEFTNEVINAAIDFDCHTEAQDTSPQDVEEFHQLIRDKMKMKGLSKGVEISEKKMYASCWVVFRCCQCGFETINKAELNLHMKSHSDVIKWTLEVPASNGAPTKPLPPPITFSVGANAE